MSEYVVTIPSEKSEYILKFNTGSSVVFVGANGSGKTRLGVEIERQLPQVHRIPAHKSLAISESVSPKNLEKAMKELLYGNEGHSSNVHRWGNKPAFLLLSDYDRLLAALFSESYELSVNHRKNHQKDPNVQAPLAVLDRIIKLWDKVLPQRAIKETSSSIKAFDPDDSSSEYSASQMSDGERAIFYFIGHCLLAPKDGVIIVDEPELHVHKSIMDILWDEIEAERTDCSFIYITHDLDFAKSRNSSQKFALRNYKNSRWDIIPVLPDDNFPEEIVSKIMGSRRPILFVEGNGNSLDLDIYQKMYPDFLIVSRGSCTDVIHAVSSFNANADLHHISCAGIIDRDDRTDADVETLKRMNVHVLPVTEIENLFLNEDVFKIVGKKLSIAEPELSEKIQEVKNLTFREAEKNKADCSVLFVKRQIDNASKKIGLSGSSIEDIKQSITESLVDANKADEFFAKRMGEFDEAIAKKDYAQIISIYDKKGLGSQVGNILGLGSKQYIQFILRLVKSSDPDIMDYFKQLLPNLSLAGKKEIKYAREAVAAEISK